MARAMAGSQHHLIKDVGIFGVVAVALDIVEWTWPYFLNPSQ